MGSEMCIRDSALYQHGGEQGLEMRLERCEEWRAAQALRQPFRTCFEVWGKAQTQAKITRARQLQHEATLAARRRHTERRRARRQRQQQSE